MEELLTLGSEKLKPSVQAHAEPGPPTPQLGQVVSSFTPRLLGFLSLARVWQDTHDRGAASANKTVVLSVFNHVLMLGIC